MAHVSDLGFSLEDLDAALADGLVRVQYHPEFPELAIYNYTEETQYRKRWNNITLQCRGLIINRSTGEVVARPWEKFFNFGEMDNRIDSNAPVDVTDKIDGSLGILYQRPDNRWAIATRGSFASEQAIHATELLGSKYLEMFSHETGIAGSGLGSDAARAYTYLFEIVYPSNRIVVDYGDTDALVLLGAVNKARGYYLSPNVAAAALIWEGPVTETFHFNNFLDAIDNAPHRPGKEGIIIRSGNKIVKLKQADYVELHRIVTNMSPRTIWEMIGQGKTIEDICKPLPDEFHTYVEKIGRELIEKASDLAVAIEIKYISARINVMAKLDVNAVPTRRQYAEEFKKSKYASYLFNRLDNKSNADAIWKAVRPVGDVKLIQEEV